MSIDYDNKCRQCNNGIIRHGNDGEMCKICDGYGYLVTFEGLAVIEFLKRRGVAFPMSPMAEEELRGMIE